MEADVIQIEQLKNELQQAKDPSQSNVDEKMSTKEQEDTLARLHDEYNNTKLQARSTYEHRFTAKEEMEQNIARLIKA